MSLRIFLARNGQALGAFAAEEIPPLLESGFLQATDEFRVEGEDNWRRLEQFAGLKESLLPATPLQTAAARAGEAIRDLAGRVAKGSAALVSSTERAAAAASNRLLEDYLPRLSVAIRERLAAARRSTAALLRDDDKLRKVFGAAYDSLPKAAHRFVSEQQFMEFCFKHRERLLGGEATKSP